MNAQCATVFTTIAGAGLLLSTIGAAPPLYIWNASNSVPRGLYRLELATTLTVTELVAVQPPMASMWGRHANATGEGVHFRSGMAAKSSPKATSLS